MAKLVKNGSDLATLVLGFLLSLANIFYKYFIVVKVWGYIAVKMFGQQPINMWQAFALATLLGMITFQYDPNTADLETATDAITRPLTSAIYLSISWAITYWIFG